MLDSKATNLLSAEQGPQSSSRSKQRRRQGAARIKIGKPSFFIAQETPKGAGIAMA